MKNRQELAKYFVTLNFKVGAEIGTAAGYFAKIICDENKGVKLYCIDVWEPYAGYSDYRRIKTFKRNEQDAINVLAPYNCVLIKKYSMDAVKDFEDNSLDFVFIDGNHKYKYVQDDIREWSKKVRIGGIVSGHDYFHRRDIGVIQAVDEYINEHKYKLQLTDWDNDNPISDDRQPCWFFVKTH